ncbi:MAG: hypothetical protein KAR17_13840, partial [Cyclobacteriaceae bacterium]|nr:hypothetical protein [Cyclobacteriaceae bacterium]
MRIIIHNFIKRNSYFLILFFAVACNIKSGTNQGTGDSYNGIESTFPDYLNIVKVYADAMISEGRDFYGAESTPLFASALNRETMKIGSKEDFGTIKGVRKNDRSIGGANPLQDSELFEILYSLSEITGNEIYAGEADKSLQYFFTHCQSPTTGLMAWGEHLYWDFENEACGYGKVNQDYHEAGAWPFWDRCYELA